MTRVDIRLSGLLFRLAGLRSVAQSCRTARFPRRREGFCLVDRQQPRIEARSVTYTRGAWLFRAFKGLLFLFTQRPLSTPFVYRRAHKSVIPAATGQYDVWNLPHPHPAQYGFAMNLEMVGYLLDCQPRLRLAGDYWRIFAPQLTSNQNYRLHSSFRPSPPGGRNLAKSIWPLMTPACFQREHIFSTRSAIMPVGLL
jgi:hypothetical protein